MRTGRYSPLRYPGGKGKLAALLKAIVAKNGLTDGTYVEPFAGGAGIACELLTENYVREIHINDVSPAIFSFWRSALDQPERFCETISEIGLSTEEWYRQKAIFEEQRRSLPGDLYDLGFSTFYLNRTNRSGILNGGMIGGKAQASAWGVDARFNRDDLIRRIRLLSSLRDRIVVSGMDAIDLISQYRKRTPYRTFMYLDPPYYAKGRQLYLDYYRPADHANIARIIQAQEQPFSWMVSYDNVQPIKDLYAGLRKVEYDITYSARTAMTGSEVIFFDPKMDLPNLGDFVRITRAIAA